MVSIGLLGLAKMGMGTIHQNHAAFYTSVANTQLNALTDCLYSVQSAMQCEQYFKTTLSSQLPGGHCYISVKSRDYKILIGWYAPHQAYIKPICKEYFQADYDCLGLEGRM